MKKLSGLKLSVLAFCAVSLGGCSTARGAWLDMKGAYQGMRASFEHTTVEQWNAEGDGSNGWDPNGGRYGPGPLDHPSYGRP